MKNILYIVAVIAIAAAAYFGFQTKKELTKQLEAQSELKEQNRQLSSTIQNESEVREVSRNARDTARSEKDETIATLSAARAKAGDLKRSLAEIDVRLDEANKRNENYETFIASLEQQVEGDNIRIEDVPTIVTSLREEQKQKEKEVEDLDLAREKLNNEVVKLKSDVERTSGKIAESKARVAGNRFEARVASVNNRWGFLVIGAGEKSGLDGNSKLIVKRGGKFVGKVAISRIEPNLAIAEVVRGSLPDGAVIQAGDRVILDEVRSN